MSLVQMFFFIPELRGFSYRVDKVLLTQKPIDSAKKLLVFRTQDKQPILIGYELETDGQGKDRVIPTEQHYLYVFFQTADNDER